MSGRLAFGGVDIKSASVPVILPTTEAEADANTVVWEMTGGSSANETGVGGGLTGADLVATQVGGVPAAVSGFRTLNGSRGFTITASAATLLAGEEFTLALLIKDPAPSDGQYLNLLLSSTGGPIQGFMHTGGLLAQTCVTARSCSQSLPLPSGPCWSVLWRKHGNIHHAVTEDDTLPGRWEDFPSDRRVIGIGLPKYGGAGTELSVVGRASQALPVDVGRIVISTLGLGAPLALS